MVGSIASFHDGSESETLMVSHMCIGMIPSGLEKNTYAPYNYN